MDYISKIKLPNGNTYNIKDSELGNKVDQLGNEYVAKSDIVDYNGDNADKVLSQTAMSVLACAPQGFVTANSDLNNYTTNGLYSISGNNRNTIKNLPVENSNSAFLLVVTAYSTKTSKSGTHHNQIYFDDTGHLFLRYISEVTGSIGPWKTPSSIYLTQSTGQNTGLIMSQKAVSDELNKKANGYSIKTENEAVQGGTGIYSYESGSITGETVIGGITGSEYCVIIHNNYTVAANTYNTQLLIPYRGGVPRGVWYRLGTEQGGYHTPIRLAEQPDLDNLKETVNQLKSQLSSQSSISSINLLSNTNPSYNSLSDYLTFGTFAFTTEEITVKLNRPSDLDIPLNTITTLTILPSTLNENTTIIQQILTTKDNSNNQIRYIRNITIQKDTEEKQIDNWYKYTGTIISSIDE